MDEGQNHSKGKQGEGKGEGKGLQLQPALIILRPEQRIHQCPVPLIGLTGGIASGKSTVADLFREKGLPILGADELVKEVYKKESSVEFVRKNFPEAVPADSQSGPIGIDFALLRQTVFNDAGKRAVIENFIYAQLPQVFREKLEGMGPIPFLIYDVPLLFEKNLGGMVDVSICVYVTPEVQRERLVRRDKISAELAEKMILSQMPLEKKRSLARFVIDNNGTLPQLKAKTLKLADDLFL